MRFVCGVRVCDVKGCVCGVYLVCVWCVMHVVCVCVYVCVC